MFIDARIPIRFGPVGTRLPGEAVLTDGAAVPPPQAGFATPSQHDSSQHPAGCPCCLPRSEAATALSRLFRERALSTGPAFNGVLAAVSPAGEQAVRAALEADPAVAGRYRLSLA